MDCWWYIHGPPGEEVQLTVLDHWTRDEVINIYDHPNSTSSSYLVSTLSGNSSGNATVVESSRGGLTMLHYDYSDAANGKGILAEIIVAGILLNVISNSNACNQCHGYEWHRPYILRDLLFFLIHVCCQTRRQGVCLGVAKCLATAARALNAPPARKKSLIGGRGGGFFFSFLLACQISGQSDDNTPTLLSWLW